MRDDSIIAIFSIMFVFGAPVLAFIVSRVLRHQERIEMLRRGIVPPPDFDKRTYRAWRKSGAPWPPPGAAWPPPGGANQSQTQAQGPWVVQPGPASAWTAPEDDPQRALYKGIRLALIGFAITLGLGTAFGGYSGNPAILFGLVPMFVGIAQIIIAVLSGAELPGVQGRTTYSPPPPPPPGPGAPPPPPPGYGAAPPPNTPPPWATRAPFEELSKPVQPPDVR